MESGAHLEVSDQNCDSERVYVQARPASAEVCGLRYLAECQNEVTEAPSLTMEAALCSKMLWHGHLDRPVVPAHG